MRTTCIVLFVLLCAACQPTTVAIAPTFDPFPTMTPGQQLLGSLPTSAYDAQAALLSNPATAIAFNNRPTPTPNRNACPVLDGDAVLARKPATLDEARASILDFLQQGGALTELKEGIRIRWQMYGDTGYALDEADLTGEGVPEILLGWSAPGKAGTLDVIGCMDGVYDFLYSFETGSNDPPRLIAARDINNAPPAELVFASVTCDDDKNCEYITQALAWDSFMGRFRSLLGRSLNTLQQPELRDIDNDSVQEIVVDMQLNGNTVTGPLRRGLNIYDWDGDSYTLSIIQLDPPRYYIQIAQEGDRQFSQLRMTEAANSYTALMNATDLRYWYNDEADWVRSYGLYRLLLTYAYLGDARQGDVATQINTEFGLTSDLTVDQLPVYALMAYRFLDSIQLNNDLHLACGDVLAVLAERPEALSQLNRYGTRSPQYGELDLCPF